MISSLALTAALQLGSALPPIYEPEVSDETDAIVAQADSLSVEQMIEQLEALGATGDDSAYELLGEVHSFGVMGVERDRQKACEYFELIGDRRPDGLHNRATCYFDGEGREQDLSKARALYLKAAENGWLQAWCAYGNMLIRGEGGPTDMAEGLRLCQRAAAAGDRDAQADYGGYLLMGVGVERDPVAARFILEQAAEQEQANAAFLLAQIHTKGDGTEVNNVLATDWFSKAYEWGRPDAAYQAGLALARRGFRMNGETMQINQELMRQAVEWFERAARVDPDPELRAQAEEMVANSRILIASAERDQQE